MFYDFLGQQSQYRQCHSTADLILRSWNHEGNEGKIFQGGYVRANDLDFLKATNIRLVINVTANIEAPPWIGHPEAPRWLRFVIPELRRDSQVLLAFNTFLPICAQRPLARRQRCHPLPRRGPSRRHLHGRLCNDGILADAF